MSMMLLGVQYDGQAHDYPISIYDNKNPFNGAYRTSDDRIIQCACPDYNVRFEQFLKAIGRQDLIDCGKYYPQTEMLANNLIKEFMDEIQKTFLEHDVKEMDEILRKGDIPHSIAYSGRTAPMIGEQGREILSEIGYTDEKIDQMLADGSLYIWQDKE